MRALLKGAAVATAASFIAFRPVYIAVSDAVLRSVSLGAYSGVLSSIFISLSRLSRRSSKPSCEDELSLASLPSAFRAVFCSSVSLGVDLRPWSLREWVSDGLNTTP